MRLFLYMLWIVPERERERERQTDRQTDNDKERIYFQCNKKFKI